MSVQLTTGLLASTLRSEVERQLQQSGYVRHHVLRELMYQKAYLGYWS